jgi:hypothetical protein
VAVAVVHSQVLVFLVDLAVVVLQDKHHLLLVVVLVAQEIFQQSVHLKVTMVALVHFMLHQVLMLVQVAVEQVPLDQTEAQ